MDFLTDLVDSTYEDLGEPDNISKGFLSGWFLDNSNLGKFNNLIDTDFSGTVFIGVSGIATGGAITPDMNGEQQAIIKKLYEYEDFNKQLKLAIRGMAGANDWISVKEGDSEIMRVNKNEAIKTLKTISRDSRQDLEDMVRNYLRFNTSPVQVVGDDDVSGGYYGVGRQGYDLVRTREGN